MIQLVQFYTKRPKMMFRMKPQSVYAKVLKEILFNESVYHACVIECDNEERRIM